MTLAELQKALEDLDLHELRVSMTASAPLGLYAEATSAGLHYPGCADTIEEAIKQVLTNRRLHLQQLEHAPTEPTET